MSEIRSELARVRCLRAGDGSATRASRGAAPAASAAPGRCPRLLSAASPQSSSRRAVVAKNLALAVLRAQLSSAPASRPPHADVARADLVPQRPGAERSGDARRSRSPLPEARLPLGCGQTPPGTPPRAERGRSRSISPPAAVRSRPHGGSATGTGRTPLPPALSSTRLCGTGPHRSRLPPP